MTIGSKIDVNYDTYASSYTVRKKLKELLSCKDKLSFDVECRSVYTKEERAAASEYLKDLHTSDPMYKQARVVAESSGLSYPSIVNTTHFIFGESRSKSTIFIANTPEMELAIWRAIAEYEGTLLIHNTLFDLKIMYQRIGKLPKNFIDTALTVKCLINHVDIWKAKTGLKDLMGEYYSPKWLLMSEYEPDDYKKESFLMYAAIDGAATYYLHELIEEQAAEQEQ